MCRIGGHGRVKRFWEPWAHQVDAGLTDEQLFALGPELHQLVTGSLDCDWADMFMRLVKRDRRRSGTRRVPCEAGVRATENAERGPGADEAQERCSLCARYGARRLSKQGRAEPATALRETQQDPGGVVWTHAHDADAPSRRDRDAAGAVAAQA